MQIGASYYSRDAMLLPLHNFCVPSYVFIYHAKKNYFWRPVSWNVFRVQPFVWKEKNQHQIWNSFTSHAYSSSRAIFVTHAHMWYHCWCDHSAESPKIFHGCEKNDFLLTAAKQHSQVSFREFIANTHLYDILNILHGSGKSLVQDHCLEASAVH